MVTINSSRKIKPNDPLFSKTSSLVQDLKYVKQKQHLKSEIE